MASVKNSAGKEIWSHIKKYEDIRFEITEDGVAKITINRPEVRNAFRPLTVQEIKDALEICREDSRIGVVIFTGEGKEAFCSGGDQKVRGHAGYVGKDGVPRLNILDVQKQIRFLPKPVIAMVAGYAVGGGHVLHVVCDLTIAADNARFGQSGTESRLVRRRPRQRLPRSHRRTKESARNLVPLPPIQRPASARNGACEPCRPVRGIGN